MRYELGSSVVVEGVQPIQRQEPALNCSQMLERALWAPGLERALWAPGLERALERTLLQMPQLGPPSFFGPFVSQWESEDDHGLYLKREGEQGGHCSPTQEG